VWRLAAERINGDLRFIPTACPPQSTIGLLKLLVAFGDCGIVGRGDCPFQYFFESPGRKQLDLCHRLWVRAASRGQWVARLQSDAADDRIAENDLGNACGRTVPRRTVANAITGEELHSGL